MFADPHVDDISAVDLCGEYPAVRYYSPDGFGFDIVTRFGEAFRFTDLEVEEKTYEGVPVKVVTPRTLWRLKKDTARPTDRIDAMALVQRFGLEEDWDAGAPVPLRRGDAAPVAGGGRSDQPSPGGADDGHPSTPDRRASGAPCGATLPHHGGGRPRPRGGLSPAGPRSVSARPARMSLAVEPHEAPQAMHACPIGAVAAVAQPNCLPHRVQERRARSRWVPGRLRSSLHGVRSA